MVGRIPKSYASASSSTEPTSKAPSQCGTRERAEDATAAVKEMADLIKAMDPALVRGLVKAREANANVKLAFPGGDQRFVDSESDDDDDSENVEQAENDSQFDSCIGLFDETVHSSTQECLEYTKQMFQFDLLEEMDTPSSGIALDFFQRIRFVNYIRKMAKEGQSSKQLVDNARRVLETVDSTILSDDAYLVPVIEGDILLTALESELDNSDQEQDDKVDNALEKLLRDENILNDS